MVERRALRGYGLLPIVFLLLSSVPATSAERKPGADETDTRDAAGAEGFGLGGSVRIDLAKGNSLGSVGHFGWMGAATTYGRIDPTERMALILLVQHLPMDQHKIFRRFSTLAYAAIVD
jgi:CubicO group peptidase (beta-lactamase class C family)